MASFMNYTFVIMINNKFVICYEDISNNSVYSIHEEGAFSNANRGNLAHLLHLLVELFYVHHISKPSKGHSVRNNESI